MKFLENWVARFVLLIFAAPFILPIALVFGLVELVKWVGDKAKL